MGSVIPLKKSANSAYLELKNLLGDKLQKVENLIQEKLKSDVSLTCGTTFFFLKIENIFFDDNYILITVKN